MKRCIAMVLTALLVLSLAACNNEANLADTSPSVTTTPSADISDTDGRGDMLDDDADGDPAYWNGFDFGPNLIYAEEYESQGYTDEYLNAAEAAKLTFNDAKDTGYIPDYSDSVEYTMTLVDIEDIDGDECYVYRCDGEDGFAAGFAYSYQVGDIYMQGQGGQWVVLIWGDGGYDDYDDSGDSDAPEGDDASMDSANVSWWGKYNSINYVLEISNYDGTSFSFTIDDVDRVDSGVAALDYDNPYSAQFGEIVFSFDGVDTINISGGDYAETYFRSQG